MAGKSRKRGDPAQERKRSGARGDRTSSISPPARSPELRGMLWGAAAIAVLTLSFVVFPHARPRSPAVTAPGEIPKEPVSAAPASEDPREHELKVELARNPEDLDKRLELARLYLDRQDMKSAWKETWQVLQRSPQNPVALTYEGLIRIAAGKPETSLEPLRVAIAKNPDLLEAYLQLAFAYLRLDRVRDAEATITTASKRFPDKAASLNRWLPRKQQEIAQERSAGTGAPSIAGAPGQTTR
jgi:cytochrome c-type biogenesis protein CcmH/NrfG